MQSGPALRMDLKIVMKRSQVWNNDTPFCKITQYFIKSDEILAQN